MERKEGREEQVEDVFTFTAAVWVLPRSLTSSPACKTQQTRWTMWLYRKLSHKRLFKYDNLWKTFRRLYKLESGNVTLRGPVILLLGRVSPFVVEAVRRVGLWGVAVARRRPLSASEGPAVCRLLVDVLSTRRQLGLQILRAAQKSVLHLRIDVSAQNTSLSSLRLTWVQPLQKRSMHSYTK